MRKLIESTLSQVPGFVLGFSVGGHRELFAYGDRQVFGADSTLPIDRHTIFDVGSVTKILGTTAGIMRLLDHGALSLDDRAAKFLSGWDVNDKAEITIRQLLRHRAGLWEWRPLYIHTQVPSKAIQGISQMPLRYPVDSERHYSDLGFISLGQILIKITGQDIITSVDDLVLKPFGLSHTRFARPTSFDSVAATSFGDSIEKEMIRSKTPYPVPEDASSFEHWRDYVLLGEVNDGNAFHVFAGASGHAGLFSSAEDLLAFGEGMNASQQGAGPYSQDVVDEFLAVGPDEGQRLGFRSWSNTFQGCTAEFFGHTGFPGVVLAFSPFHDCVITLLTNRLHVQGVPAPTEQLWTPFLDLIHQKLHSE